MTNYLKNTQKNVNLGDKKSQTRVKKTQKCIFKWKKIHNIG